MARAREDARVPSVRDAVALSRGTRGGLICVRAPWETLICGSAGPRIFLGRRGGPELEVECAGICEEYADVR